MAIEEDCQARHKCKSLYYAGDMPPSVRPAFKFLTQAN
jgi:hypothetical protein